jgi:probable rRNA maturation factor
MSDPSHRSFPRRVVFRQRWNGLLRSPLQQFAEELSQQVLKGRDFSCLIADDEEIAALNQQFRGKSGSTDVLSFPAEDGSDYAGDIAISINHAREQAKQLGHSLSEEIRVLMLHGALHLAGMDHETDNGTMRRRENLLRKRFQLPVTLIARNS